MAVPATVVEVTVNDVAEGVPEAVSLQTYDPAWVSVRYGDESKELAVVDTDYTVEISGDFDTVTITPLESLIDKINDLGEANVIYVRRTLPLTTDITENDVQFREKIAEEFDKAVMRDQQLADTQDDALDEIAAEKAARIAADQVLQTQISALGGSGGDYSFKYESRAAAILASISVLALSVWVGGYATPDDGGAASYKRVISEPAHEGKFQSADGAWWEIYTKADEAVSVGAFGCRGDGVTNDITAFQDAVDSGFPLYIPADFDCIFEVTATVNAVILSGTSLELYGPGRINIVSASGGPHRFRGITLGTVGSSGNGNKNGVRIEGVKFYSEIDKEFSTFIDLQNRGGDLRNVYIKGNEFVYAPSTTPSTRPETGDRWAISWGGDPGDVRDGIYIEDNKCIGSMQFTANGGWPTSYNDIRICNNIIRDSYNAAIALSRTGDSSDMTTYTNIKIRDNDIISQWGKIGIFLGADSEGSSPSPGTWDDVEIEGNSIELAGTNAIDILIRVPCSDNLVSSATNIRLINNRCKSLLNASLSLVRHTGVAATDVDVNLFDNEFRMDVYVSAQGLVHMKANDVTGTLLPSGGCTIEADNNTLHALRLEGSAGTVRSISNTYRPLASERAINIAPSSGQTGTLLSVSDKFIYTPSSGQPTSAYRLATAGATISCTIINPDDGARNWSAGFVSLNDGHTATVIRQKQSTILADAGDAAYTYSNVTSPQTIVYNTPITANRAVALSTTAPIAGTEVHVVRTAAATGAFTVNVGTGPLAALAAGEWCIVKYNGTAWILTAKGSLT